VDFYHTEACLIGLDTLKLSFSESAEILNGLLPGFKEGIFSPPDVETVSLDGALGAYRAIDEELPSKSLLFVLCKSIVSEEQTDAIDFAVLSSLDQRPALTARQLGRGASASSRCGEAFRSGAKVSKTARRRQQGRL
jgi:hypothetical protein